MLSKRLQKLSEIVSDGNRLADIGTDHGFVPIELVKSGKIPSAIACDIGRGPLLRAKEHIEKAGLFDYIETRLSDGLQGLKPEEADTVLIAGMGGRLMQRILEGWKDLSGISEWIFQPQSEIAEFRRYIISRNLYISDEEIVFEDGKYYPIILAKPGHYEYIDDMSAEFGPVLLKKKDSTLRSFLVREEMLTQRLIEKLDSSESNGAICKLRQLEYRRELIEKALVTISN